MKNANISIHHWSEACYLTTKMMNLTPSSVHGFPPIMIIRGCLSAEVFRNYTPPIPLEEIWKQVHASLKKKQESRLNLPSKNRGKGKILEPGTKVMIYSGVDGKKTYTGKVILDHGVTCLVEKDGVWNRFGTVLAHKSRLRVLKDF